MQVGVILSANRWTRLFTNGPAARLLGTSPVRVVFATALSWAASAPSYIAHAPLLWWWLRGACGEVAGPFCG